MDKVLHSVFGVVVILAYFILTTQMVLPVVFGKWLKRAPNQSKTSVFMLLFIVAFILGAYGIGLYFFPALFKCPDFFTNHPKYR